jgi:hypothetical protein
MVESLTELASLALSMGSIITLALIGHELRDLSWRVAQGIE